MDARYIGSIVATLAIQIAVLLGVIAVICAAAVR
jgi:hypothetical protein